MSIKQVSVPSASAAESTITSYLAQGFIVANRTEDKIVLQKTKQFSVLWAVIGFIICLLPLIIYLIIYATKPAVEIVEICIVKPGPDAAPVQS
jgi:hypothetical protein